MTFARFFPPYCVLYERATQHGTVSVWLLDTRESKRIASIMCSDALRSFAFDGKRLALLYHHGVAVYDVAVKLPLYFCTDEEESWAKVALLGDGVAIWGPSHIKLCTLKDNKSTYLYHGLKATERIVAYSASDAAVFATSNSCYIVDGKGDLSLVPGNLVSLSPVLVAQENGCSISVVDKQGKRVMKVELPCPGGEVAVGDLVSVSQPWECPNGRSCNLITIWTAPHTFPLAVGVNDRVGKMWVSGKCVYVLVGQPDSLTELMIWDVEKMEFAKYKIAKSPPFWLSIERRRGKDINANLLKACVKVMSGKKRFFPPDSLMWLSALTSPDKTYLQWGEIVGFSFPVLPQLKIDEEI